MNVEVHWHGEAVVAASVPNCATGSTGVPTPSWSRSGRRPPVDTGVLRGSVHKTALDRANRISVVAGALDAGNVVPQPRYSGPNPFFLRAVEKAAPQILDTLSGRK